MALRWCAAGMVEADKQFVEQRFGGRCQRGQPLHRTDGEAAPVTACIEQHCLCWVHQVGDTVDSAGCGVSQRCCFGVGTRSPRVNSFAALWFFHFLGRTSGDALRPRSPGTISASCTDRPGVGSAIQLGSSMRRTCRQARQSPSPLTWVRCPHRRQGFRCGNARRHFAQAAQLLYCRFSPSPGRWGTARSATSLHPDATGQFGGSDRRALPRRAHPHQPMPDRTRTWTSWRRASRSPAPIPRWLGTNKSTDQLRARRVCPGTARCSRRREIHSFHRAGLGFEVSLSHSVSFQAAGAGSCQIPPPTQALKSKV